MTYAKSNKTGKSTPNDVVMTNPETAKWIVNYFKPIGICLDPCAGNNAFYNSMLEPKIRLEISEGSDFFEFNQNVDWIITNPPFSIYDEFLFHAFKIAKNVVWFVPLNKAFKSKKIDQAIQQFGGLKEIVMMGGGGKHGFPFGFPVGCLHYQKNYVGDIKLTRHYETNTCNHS
jgi:hypothetical protein